jgi:uncharacterized protein (UPF0216 family)
MIDQIFEDFKKISYQRAFYMSVISTFLSEDVDEDSLARFKVNVTQAFIDNIAEKGMLIEDDIEVDMLKNMLSSMQSQNAVLRVKRDVSGNNPY